MAVLLVTYELNTPNKEYSQFFDTLKKTPRAWWHYLKDVWLVDTDISADGFAKVLYPHITQDDRLLITKLSGEHQGWLTQEAWDWINARKY